MLRFLLLLVLAYFVVRTVRNLLRTVVADGGASAPLARPASPAQPEASVRRVWDAEVEEARYRDL